MEPEDRKQHEALGRVTREVQRLGLQGKIDVRDSGSMPGQRPGFIVLDRVDKPHTLYALSNYELDDRRVKQAIIRFASEG